MNACMLRRGCAALLTLAMVACAGVPASAPPGPEATAPTMRFVVVRHAEKQTGPASASDPALTDAGHQRATRLAASLADDPVVAVYASGYRRTRETAAPTARGHGLPVVDYDPRQPVPALVAALRSAHPHGTVLVVGHSNTVPAIAAALCACEVAPMSEDEYDHRYLIDIDATGRARLRDVPLP